MNPSSISISISLVVVVVVVVVMVVLAWAYHSCFVGSKVLPAFETFDGMVAVRELALSLDPRGRREKGLQVMLKKHTSHT